MREWADPPKQPFDWNGRTGTVSFDVTNDASTQHGAWPEFWITDQPIPAPVGATTGGQYPYIRNGVGFTLAFLASLVVVKPFLAFVRRSGFGVFAWYRIAAGAAVLAAVALGWL